MTRHHHRITVVIEAAEEGGYYAFCPSLPGCYSQGETLEDAKRHIQEAVQCHIESLLKDGEPLPLDREEFVSAVDVLVPATHGR